jgi:hypothetical protein
MNFTGVNAGTISFDAAQLAYSSGNRLTTLRLYYGTDGNTFTELTGTNLPFVATNNVPSSATISVALPAAFNNSPSARLRFYCHNGPTGGSTGSRPKITVDNVTVTATNAVAPITGLLNMCEGFTSTLSSTTSEGTWSSSTTGTATVDGSGVVTGVTAGTTIISYTAGGCSATAAVTVNALPAAITGGTSVCIGNTTLMSNTTTGGTWSSSTTGTATIDASGLVTGVSAGSATITYTLATGCYTTANVNVISCPTNIDMIADWDKTISIFPNPSKGEFQVVVPPIGAPTEITITDMAGRMIEHNIYAGKENINYALKVNAGCYTIKITAGNKVYRQVLVITGE